MRYQHSQDAVYTMYHGVKQKVEANLTENKLALTADM